MTDKLVGQDESFDAFFEQTLPLYLEWHRSRLALSVMLNIGLVLTAVCADAENKLVYARVAYLLIWLNCTLSIHNIQALQRSLGKNYKHDLKKCLVDVGTVHGIEYFQKAWGKWTAERAVSFLVEV